MIGTGLLNIPYYILNQAINKKQRSCFHFNWKITQNMGAYTDTIYSWKKNDLEQNIGIFQQAFQELGLKITLSKIEATMWNWYESCDGAGLDSIILIQNIGLLNSKHIK